LQVHQTLKLFAVNDFSFTIKQEYTRNLSMGRELPRRIRYCIIGAGIHGLSTAYHIAKDQKSRGADGSQDIIVIDKAGVAAGASGIACGIVRNNYFQPAMSALMVKSIECWEQHAEQLQYHSVGYLAIAGPRQSADLKKIAQRHDSFGFPHIFVEGRNACREYLQKLFPDWKDSDAESVLHEQKGGFAYSREAIEGLAELVTAGGVSILSGVEVTGFELGEDGESVSLVQTTAGDIEIDTLVVAVGPWIKNCWEMLQLPNKIDVRSSTGELYANRDMWTYWQLQEGEVQLSDDVFRLPDGGIPPVMHIDSEDPLFTEGGKQVTDGPWGIYFKRDRGNVQGGTVPLELGTEAHVEPYGPASPHYTVQPSFVEYWTAGLARSLMRFENCRLYYKDAPSGGIGCFSADNFPVFDFMRPNVYVIADSNHGFKMLGVGKEVASVLAGERSKVLEPFRFSRFVEGELHPVSNSPFPWA